jgi:hypothetical protein
MLVGSQLRILEIPNTEVARMSKRSRAQQRSKKRRDRASDKSAVDKLACLLASLPAGPFPGACDKSVSRPDLIKFELARSSELREPGRSKFRQFRREYETGKLAFVRDIEHWAMERFYWHGGSPGDSWHPIDAYLQEQGGRFTELARRQLRRWKEAKLTVLEIGPLCNGPTVALRAWDLLAAKPAGSWFQAIDLAIGGAAQYSELEGQLTLTWLAPWSPEEDLFCAMGYGMSVRKDSAAALVIPRLTADAELACARWPWNATPRAAREYTQKWCNRQWQSWFEARVKLPFEALLLGNPPQISRVERLLPATVEQSRRMGIYFEVCGGDAPIIAGATAIMPVDLASVNAAALAEYAEYRNQSGPPPGCRQRHVWD